VKGRVIEMSDTANEAGRAKIFACSVLKSEVDTLRRTVNDIHQDLAFADARTNSGRGTRGESLSDRMKLQTTTVSNALANIEKLSIGITGDGTNSATDLGALSARVAKSSAGRADGGPDVKKAATAAMEAFAAACASKFPQLPHGPTANAGHWVSPAPAEQKDESTKMDVDTAAPSTKQEGTKEGAAQDTAMQRAIASCTSRKILQVTCGESTSVGKILSGCIHIQVVCQGVFRAMLFCTPESLEVQSEAEIVLRRILIYGSDEKALDSQPWFPSSFAVFRRMTENASAAVEQMRPPACCSPLSTLLAWLESYRTIFTEPSAITGRGLELHSAAHGFLPPTGRSHYAHQAYHS